MSAYLGFIPSQEKDAFFVGYNNEDNDKISGLTTELYNHGVPLWYDYGLNDNKERERQISEHMKNCRAVLLFITSGAFNKTDTDSRKEYNLAKTFKKKIYVVFIDQLNQSMISPKLLYWWFEMLHLQAINEPTAQKIMEAIDFSVARAVNMDDLNSMSDEELFDLGESYYYGQNGKEIDLGLAFKIFKIVADHGVVDAQYILACMYGDGDGVEINYSKCVEYLKKAYNGGNIDAIVSLGMSYQYGNGVEKDYKKAMDYYKIAAEKGHLCAYYYIGTLYSLGWGVPKNEQKQLYYFKMSADMGYPKAQLLTGLMYEEGVGTEEDDSIALKYYQLAADNNIPEALFKVGMFYFSGHIVNQDDNVAAKYFFRSSELGYVRAQSMMGACYLNGFGVERNLVEAKKYFELAAAQGDEKAEEELSRLQL